MKVLVTGGAGFIGSHIVDALINDGYDVVIVDNLSTGKPEYINKKATFYKQDITKDIEYIFKKERPDYVNHQAAQTNLNYSVINPNFDANVNIIGSLNVIKNCVKYEVKKIIYASSGGAIYGNICNASEETKIDIISPYGVSKYTGELYLKCFSHLYNLKYTILRYSNVYGPRQLPKGESGVVSIFINRFLNRKQPIIYGDGTQLRDFVYIEDVVRANLLALKKGDNSIFNIGTGIPTSINKLFLILKRLLNSDQEPKYEKPRPGDLTKNSLNIDKARKLLHWHPKVDLEFGLKKTIEWFKCVS